MTKKLERMFPLAIAILAVIIYQFLYRPPRQSLEAAFTVLLFFTALAWSALIYFSLERRHWLRYVYALAALVLSIFIVEIVRLFPHDRLLQRLLIGFNLLGMVMIEFYLRNLRKEQDKAH